MDAAKDRLYISAADGFRRRSCQTVLHIALENIARAIAPVLCHMAEDIWQFLPYETPYKSVFEAGWVHIEDKWQNPELAAFWEELRKIRTQVNKDLENKRIQKEIGSSLQAKLLLYVPDEELRKRLQILNPNSDTAIKNGNGVDELRYLFLVSQVKLLEPSDLTMQSSLLPHDQQNILVGKAEGEKCDRCWNYSTHVGESAEHPLLCERCVDALAGEF